MNFLLTTHARHPTLLVHVVIEFPQGSVSISGAELLALLIDIM